MPTNNTGGFSWTQERLEYFVSLIAEKYQAKVAGKGLSTNDFTNELLTKLNGIAQGATANVGTVTGVQMNGTTKSPGQNGVVDLGTVITAHQDISGKANLASPEFTGTPKVPTATAGTNTTQAASTAFVAAAITAALAGITGVDFEFVQTLPASGEAGTFYFVPDPSGSGTNNFIEYVWNANSSKFEEVGRPSVDLSGYMKEEDWPVITESEILALFS